MLRPNTFSKYFSEKVIEHSDIGLAVILTNLCSKFGLSHATYFGTRLPGTEIGEDVLITTYKPSWIKHYADQEYKYVDPILSCGFQSLLPLDWSIVPTNSPSLRTFFGEATDFGVGSCGLTIPVRGIYGEIGLFSINAETRCREWKKFQAEYMSDVTYLAFLVHNQVLKERGLITLDQNTILTPREQDVLRWAAHGKTAWETAQILNLSYKTVSFYISNAIVKLRVATKTQAVAKAISERLILI